ncbi:hypothetical protein MI149_14530 [Mycolicibacterium crocinum]|uniref:Uncharacterized protein n=1 Tax=Mycolicibacterium crocinum TaxID=388459 RepID=A0ABY3TVV4_9MYCO|nr:hypothetical protein [Mycolicibacterium crocinum]ULN44174.1 hypothetical protein MI149_14530 [Mycolicibacterium crocinum]
MGPLGFGERLLWIGFVGPDRRMIKTLTQMPIGRAPDRAVLSDLLAGMMMIAQESAPGSTLALLLTRPGCDGISAEDRRWSDVIAHIAREQNVSLEALFRANDQSLLPL